MYKHLSFLSLLTVLMAACAQEPRDTDIASVVALQQDHDGQRIRVEGRVRSFEEPLHYWVEDEELNRIQLLPEEAASDYVDTEVRVSGRFHYDTGEGRRLEVEEIESLEP